MSPRKTRSTPPCHSRAHLLAVTAVLVLAISSTARSQLNIILQEAPAGTTLTPTYDANLDELGNIMAAAASYWEDIILDNHTVTVTYGYADFGPGIHGFAEVTNDDGLRATTGNVAFDIENNMAGDWYFDPTPQNHSEFSMHQVLYRDLGGPAQNLYYDNVAPDVLEVGYWGDYVGPDQGRDALTNAVHELGHILGLSAALPNFAGQTADGEYDFNIFYTQGSATHVNYHSPAASERDHVRSSDSTMAVGAGNGDRNLPSATDVFAAASVSNWFLVDLPRKDFWGNGATEWNNPFNWPGNRQPDAADDVYVRNGASASLTISNGAAGNLFVQEESVVSTGNETLHVTDKLTIEGVNPGAQANVVVNANGRVTAHEIELNEGGLLTLTSGVTEEIDADIVDINAGGVLLGNGDVRVNAILRNDGTISAIAGAGDELRLLTGPVDLDGVDGDGEVFAVLGNLRVSAAYSDPFDGRLTIGAGRHVELFGTTWEVGQTTSSDAEIIMQGGGLSNPARLIKPLSSILFSAGSLQVSGRAEIDGPTSFEDAFTTNIQSGGRLVLNDQVTYHGGSHQGDGQLQFESAVAVEADTTLAVATVDLDGSAGTTPITLQNSKLTINANQLDLFDNRFDGSLDISGLGAGLVVNLANAGDSWQMDGVMQAGVGGILAQETLAGNPVEVSGTINVNGLSQISAPMTLSGSIVTANVLTDVRLAGGPHVIENTASITGPGELRVGASAHLLVEDGGSVDVDIVTGGRFEVGTSLGTITAQQDFEQTSIGTLAMGIAGAPGIGQDLLQVTGVADLEGELEVTLVDGTMPSIGPVYTLVTADSVVGTFDTFTLLAHPIFEYEAALSYPGTRVTLRFTDVSMFGDFDDNLSLGCADVDALVAEIASGGMDLEFDLNGDAMVDLDDLELWLEEAGEFNVGGAYLLGDANLDGVVDGQDFVIWNANKFTAKHGWCGADFNADGFVDGQDFIIWNSNKFMSSDAAPVPVPEPDALISLLLLVGLIVRRKRATHTVRYNT